MPNRLFIIADKQPVNIAVPTFLDQISQFLPTLANNPALANTGVGIQTEQIYNVINQIKNTQNLDTIKNYVQRIDMPLKQILTIINTKMPAGGNVPSDIGNALNQVKTLGDQIAKWNKSVGVVPSKPPQPGSVMKVPTKPFSTQLKGPRLQRMQSLMAPVNPAEWQEAREAEKPFQPAGQTSQVTQEEIAGAAKEIAASQRQETKMASNKKRIDDSDNEWLGLFETQDGYIFASELRGNGTLVAVLGYTETDDGIKFVGRFENVPCQDNDTKLVSLTGMAEDGEDPREAAVREMKEESGIDIDTEDLIPLGTVRPSKAMDTTCHLFAVDIGDKTPGKAEGDGSDGEKGTYAKFVSMRDIVKSDNSILHSLLIRLLEYLD